MFTVWLMKRCYVLGILWWKALVQNIMWIDWPSFSWVIVIEQSCVLSPFSYSQITSLKKKMKDYFLSNRRWHFFISFQSYKHNFAQACLSKEMFLMWTMWPIGLLLYFHVDMIWNIPICKTYQCKFQFTHTIFKRENTLCRP